MNFWFFLLLLIIIPPIVIHYKLFQKFILFISIVFLTTCASTRNWFRVNYDDILYLEFKHFGTDSVYIYTPDELRLIDDKLFYDDNFDLTAIVFKSNVE